MNDNILHGFSFQSHKALLVLGLTVLLFSGCISQNKTAEIEYMEFSKPWPGSEKECFDLAKKGFDKVCEDTLLKESPIISCDRWWAQTEVFQGLDGSNEYVCIMRIPKALKMVKI